MKRVPEYFGSMVFDDRVMKARLSAEVYDSLRKTIDQGTKLDLSVANAVAAAMKDWAVEKGATHFTHDRHHGGKARQLHYPRARWPGDSGVFRQGTD